MKKQIIRLTESDLHNIITESVNRILNESSSHSEEYIMVDVYDVDFKDERVLYFLDDNQDNHHTIAIHIRHYDYTHNFRYLQ